MTLAASGYKFKKDLKAAVGQVLGFTETSYFGTQGNHPLNGEPVVGPNAVSRKWFAQVWTDKDGVITKVS